MTWLKLDDKMAQHPKIAGLSDGAFRLHIHAMLYCSGLLTDGRVPMSALQFLGGSKSKGTLIAELVRASLWVQIANDAWMIKNFLEWNPSKKETEEKRAAKARAGQVGGQRSKRGPSKTEAHAQASAYPDGEPSASVLFEEKNNPRPDPSIEDPPTPFDSAAVREVARRAFGEGIRTVIDGPLFIVTDAEASVLTQAIGQHQAWCGLRAEQLAQAIRQSAAAYARDRGADSKFEQGLSPTKWVQWLRSSGTRKAAAPIDLAQRRSNQVQEEIMRKHGL